MNEILKQNVATSNFAELFTIQNLIIYLIIINILSFIVMWIDKRKAQKGKWRISEATLFTFVLLGGSIGGIAGMYVFHHKTKKLIFVLGFPLILVLEIILLVKILM